MSEIFGSGGSIDWQALALLWGTRIVSVLLILLAGLWLARRLSRAVRALLGRAGVEAILSNFFGNVAHAAVLVLVFVTALDLVGVPPTSLLAVMGAAGLAVGLAMKDSLSNIASGVMLIVLRPFRSGDVVDIAGITGVVQQVRLFQTELRSFENHAITLPNGQITAAPIVNFTAHPTRRVDVPVGIEYGCDIKAARALLLSLAKSHPAVLETPAAEVAVLELADSSVNLVLRAWVNTPDFAGTRSDLLEATHRELPAAGFGIPFPQRELHLSLDAASAALLGSQAKREKTEA